jgi:hypothetical protein
LWDGGSQTLILPAALASAYQTVIDRNNLRDLAETRNLNDSPIGGITEERTNQHLAQGFDGSVARAQLALLDPKSDLSDASNLYLTTIAGNRVSVTDAPCGAGAAALSFLANVAELRARDILPREPLDVSLIGAELSDPARRYAQELLLAVQPFLESQGIFVEAQFVSWDVTNDLSNTDLINKMTLASANHPNRLLIVANFNGFLEREGKREEAQPRLTELFRFAAGPKSLAVWIEPAMNRAVNEGGLLPWLRQLIATVWRRFAADRSPSGAPVLTSSAHFRLPLQPHRRARVGLAVIPIELARTP